LQGLYLKNNKLVSVPKEIGQLQALQGLYLKNNGLPTELDRFKGDLEEQNK